MNNFQEINCSAPGKIIITGEHAVVYGAKAISCAINLFTTCTLKLEENFNENFHINIILYNLNVSYKSEKKNIFLIKQFLQLLKFPNDLNSLNDYIQELNPEIFLSIINSTNTNEIHFTYIFNIVMAYVIITLGDYEDKVSILELFLKSNQISFSISSEIPHNAGLGSSAAYNVTIISCLLQLTNLIFGNCNLQRDKNALIILSLSGEKLFHLKPSGIDNVTCVYGGVILFESLNNYTSLPMDFLNKLELFLFDTKIRRDTKKFISKVTNFKMNFEKIFMNSVNSINQISIDILEIFNKKITTSSDLEKFFKLIEINQNLLDIIQVSSDEINNIVLLLKKKNIISKLTGAGGGGFVLAFTIKNSDINFDEILFPVIKFNLNLNGCSN